jgi:SagB-type dehydrogenase family enzyme
LGITGYVKTPSGNLPLAMTPSGGARNPFEAYVILRRGSDLSPGVYHYSAAEHSLQQVRGEMPAEMAPLLANQNCCSEMSAYIVLVGVFERTMWKYQDPNAYRVVLIEAGHVAHNIMVAATNLGLTACPTAAIAHGPMSETLSIDSLTHVPMYVLTLDKPAVSLDEIQPNPLLGTPMVQALGMRAA